MIATEKENGRLKATQGSQCLSLCLLRVGEGGGGGLAGRERREGSMGRREISANQAGGGDEKDGGAGRSSKGSSSGRSSSVPPLQRQPVDPWAEAGDKFQVFETIIIIITLIALLVVIVKDEKLQVFEAVPGRDRRESRSNSSRGRSARLEPMVEVKGGGGDGTWPQPGNPTFLVYPAVPQVNQAPPGQPGFQVFEAVPGKD